MARHALLLSGQRQLDEALALDPGAELVSEAAGFLNGGWEIALAAHDQTLRSASLGEWVEDPPLETLLGSCGTGFRALDAWFCEVVLMTSTQRQPDLADQTVVVIGASAGIGLETARQVRAAGAQVILVGRDPERLERAARELNPVSTVSFDATDTDRLKQFF